MNKLNYTIETCPPWSTSSESLFIAYSILRTRKVEAVKVQHLRDDFGMNRATAFRWLRAIKNVAEGVPGHCREQALRIAIAFKDATPTRQELQKSFKMSDASAWRKISAIKAARGEF
jgi:hypothetical protein